LPGNQARQRAAGQRLPAPRVGAALGFANGWNVRQPLYLLAAFLPHTQPLATTSAPKTTIRAPALVTNFGQSRVIYPRRIAAMTHPQLLFGTSAIPDITPAQGILAGTHVRSLDGVLPVEFLGPGDGIVTRRGTARLVSISSRLHKMATVVRILASTLGHDRPERDLVIGPGQCVLIRDWRARVLYGTAVAAIPAARLADGEFVCHELLPMARLYTLHFAGPQVIYAEGLEVACLGLAATAPA
jgi:hypothetical protein